MYKILLQIFLFSSSLIAIELPLMTINSSKLDDLVLESAQTVELIDQKKIGTYNIKDVKDLSSTVANTNISGLGSRTNRTFTFRGISNYVAYESSVAMYIDDIPLPFSFGYGILDINNISKVEILKGPQGTQFGKGAQSAVINIYTKPATKVFQSEVSADFGSYNSKDFYGRVSGPMGSKDFRYAFSLSKSSREGFSENLLTGNRVDDRDLISLSAKFSYNPNTPWNVMLNYTKSKSDDGGSAFKANTKENPFKIDDKPFDDSAKMDNDLLSLIIKYKERNYTFTSATSYSHEAVLKSGYADAIGGLLIDLDVDIQELTQELRLNYNFEDVDILVGAFYSNKLKFDYKENIYSYAYNLSSTNDLHNPDENSALFTEARYWFATDYAVTFGLRYQETKRSFERTLNQFGGVAVAAQASTTWTHLLPTLSFSYYADDNSHSYLRYAKGYRPGGYNYRAPGTILVPFEPEVTESVELGHKQNFSNLFNVNGNLFYNSISDHRTVTFDTNLATTVENAKKAYSYGAELDLSYQKDNFLFYTTLGIIEARFKEFDSATESYNGKKLLDVPDMTAAIGATYYFDEHWFTQPSVRYMGKRYYDITNKQKEEGYTTVDINFGYSDAKAYKALMYATNLFDAENVDFAIHTPTNNYYHFANPRVIGFKLSASF